ncbi:MAG: hypothetical protein ACTII7_11410 [Galactobacter sp.]
MKVTVRLRFFPSETRSLELLTSLASLLEEALDTTSQLLGPDRPDAFLRQLEELEVRAGDLHYALLTHLRSSFINVLPREDLYDFSRELHRAVSAVVGAAPLLPDAVDSKSITSERLPELLEILRHQATLARTALSGLGRLEFLEDAWLDLLRLTSRARRARRDWSLEIADLPKASTSLRRKVLADELGRASDSLANFADRLGHVLVKES